MEPSDLKVNQDEGLKFECGICSKEFSTTWCLQIHVKTHDEKRSFDCHECGKIFPDYPGLCEHLKQHIFGEEPALEPQELCSICRKEYPRSQISMHERNHIIKPGHTCKICGKSFGSSQVLKLHLRTHNKNTLYHCVICNLKFVSKNSFTLHWKCHPTLVPPLFEKRGNNLSREHAEEQKCSSRHSILQLSTKVKNNQKKTDSIKAFTVEGVSSVIEGAQFISQTKDFEEVLDPSVPTVSCKECHKKFMQSEDLETHLNSHIEEYASCLLRVFSTKDNMKLSIEPLLDAVHFVENDQHSKDKTQTGTCAKDDSHNQGTVPGIGLDYTSVQNDSLELESLHDNDSNVDFLPDHDRFDSPDNNQCKTMRKVSSQTFPLNKVTHFTPYTELQKYIMSKDNQMKCKICSKQFYSIERVSAHVKNHLKKGDHTKHFVKNIPDLHTMKRVQVVLERLELNCIEKTPNTRENHPTNVSTKAPDVTCDMAVTSDGGQDEENENLIRSQNTDVESNDSDTDADSTLTKEAAVSACTDDEDFHPESNYNEKEQDRFSEISNRHTSKQSIQHAAQSPHILESLEDKTDLSKGNRFTSSDAKKFIVEEDGKFKCLKCQKSLGFMHSAIGHVKKHLRGACFKCSKCSFATYTKHHLQRHFKQHTSKENIQHSVQSPQILENLGDKSDLSKPIRFTSTDAKKFIIEEDGKFKCLKCPKILSSIQSALDHVKRHLRGACFKCSKCSFATYTKLHLQLHFEKHNPSKKNMKTSDSSCSSSNEVRTSISRENFDNAVIEAPAASRPSSLVKEKIIKQDDQCVNRHLQGTSVSSNSMTWTSISREKFDSAVKETPVASHLSSSVKENIIKKGGKYVCKICSNTFELKSKCYSHVGFHYRKNKFVCPDCGYASHSRSVLAVHMRIHKKKMIEFACGICQSAFATNPLLASHIKSHSDEDKIKHLNYRKCDKCDKVFKYRKLLYRHKLQHLDTFVCKCCDEIFSSAVAFENHTYEMSHFFCEECGKTFTSLTVLETHQKKVHQKLLTFHCDECGKQFATNDVLRQHARSHELKHSCKECQASFTTLRKLKSHQSNMKHKVLGAPHVVKVREKDLLCEQIKDSRLRKKKCIKVKIGNCTTTAMQNAISVGSNGQHEKQGNFIRHPNADSKSNEQDVGNTSGMAADIAVFHDDQDDAHENLNIHTESNTNEKELEHLEGPSDTSNSTSFDQCIDDDAKLPQPLQGGQDTTNPSKANVYSSAYAKRFIVEENGKYKCVKCEKSLGFMDSAIHHVKRHLQGACFKCTMCPYATYTRNRLRRHFKCHNPSKKDMDILNSQMDSIDTSKSRNVQGTSSIKKNIIKQDNKYVCKICSKKFEMKSKCYSHVQSHFVKNKFVCPDCGYSAYSRSILAVHMIRIHKKKMIEFACGICQSAFETNPLLASHIKSHSDEDKIKYLNYRKCDECGKVFKYRKQLYRHKLQHLDTFRCKCCDEVFSSAVAFEDHTYENSHFFCEKCRKTYSSLTRLEDHQRMVHEKVLAFQCEVCDKQFVTNDVLNQHAQTHQLKHSCKECQTPFTSFNALKSHQCDKHEVITAPHSFEVREDELQCEMCGRHFKTAGLLETHRLIHQALEEIGDDKRDGQHLGNIKPSQTLKCPKCPKTFKTVHHFREHVRYHFLEKKYKCDICDVAFVHKSNILYHKNKHNNKRPFQCELCPRAFFDKSSRTQHIKARHQKQAKKIVTCDICGKKVTNLWQHKIRHDKNRYVKTFPCEQCDKKFYFANQVKVHLKTHSNEPVAICDICGKSLKSKNSLREHLKGHTGEKPFKCGTCDKTFKLKQWLQRHLRVHTGEKPYVCDICNKAFNEPETLKNHRYIHTGEKPYKCHLCGERFKDRWARHKHIKSHGI